MYIFFLLLVVICTNCFFIYCSDDAAKDDGGFVETVAHPQDENKGEGAKVDEGVSSQQLLLELPLLSFKLSLSPS